MCVGWTLINIFTRKKNQCCRFSRSTIFILEWLFTYACSLVSVKFETGWTSAIKTSNYIETRSAGTYIRKQTAFVEIWNWKGWIKKCKVSVWALFYLQLQRFRYRDRDLDLPRKAVCKQLNFKNRISLQLFSNFCFESCLPVSDAGQGSHGSPHALPTVQQHICHFEFEATTEEHWVWLSFVWSK